MYKKKIKRICLFCKKEFYIKFNSIRNKYCSHKCYTEDNKNEKHWAWDGGLRKNNPKEYHKKHWKEYYKEHREELIEKVAKYYWEHLDECRKRGTKYSKLWKKNNPEKARLNAIISHHRRRARKMELNETFGREQMEIVRNTFDNNCFKCNSKENLTFDHHNPLSAGFALNLDNAVLLCNSCNCKKSKMEPERFYNSRELEVLNQLLEIQKLN